MEGGEKVMSMGGGTIWWESRDGERWYVLTNMLDVLVLTDGHHAELL